MFDVQYSSPFQIPLLLFYVHFVSFPVHSFLNGCHWYYTIPRAIPFLISLTLILCSPQYNTFFDMFAVDFVQFLFLGWPTGRRGLSTESNNHCFSQFKIQWLQNARLQKTTTSNMRLQNIWLQNSWLQNFGDFKIPDFRIQWFQNFWLQNAVTSKPVKGLNWTELTSKYITVKYSTSEYIDFKVPHFRTQWLQNTWLHSTWLQNTVTSKYWLRCKHFGFYKYLTFAPSYIHTILHSHRLTFTPIHIHTILHSHQVGHWTSF